jgi:steroid delta-isomerase-like uncharacterized protein
MKRKNRNGAQAPAKSKNVATVQASIAMWNKHDWQGAVSAYAENATFVDHSREITYKGRDQIIGAWEELVKGFPDAEATEMRTYDGGDTVITTLVGRGTNDGELMGMPATKRRASSPICSIAHFDSNGLVDREEQYSDNFSLLVQLGHAEAPARI